MAKMDLPPEFVFEHKGKDSNTNTLLSDTSSASEVEPDDAARGSPTDPEKSLKRKHNKVVTFANEPDLPEQQYSDDDDEADEDEQQRCMFYFIYFCFGFSGLGFSFLTFAYTL